jgi:hypothetical protein
MLQVSPTPKMYLASSSYSLMGHEQFVAHQNPFKCKYCSNEALKVIYKVYNFAAIYTLSGDQMGTCLCFVNTTNIPTFHLQLAWNS